MPADDRPLMRVEDSIVPGMKFNYTYIFFCYCDSIIDICSIYGICTKNNQSKLKFASQNFQQMNIFS